MDDGRIRTQLDELLSSLRETGGKPISAGRLSSLSGMRGKEVLKWLHVLEREGKVHLENRLDGVYAIYLSHLDRRTQQQIEAERAGFQADLELARMRGRVQGAHQSVEAGAEEGDWLARRREREARAPASGVEAPEVRSQPQGLRGERKASILAESGEIRQNMAALEGELSKVERAIGRLESIREGKGEPGSIVLEKLPEREGKGGPGQEAKPEEKIAWPGREEGQPSQPKPVSPKLPEIVKAGLPEEEKPVPRKLPEMAKTVLLAGEEKPLPRKLPERIAYPEETIVLREQPAAQSQKIIPLVIPRIERKLAKKKIARIRQPQLPKPTQVSLQFSEKLARHMHRIQRQSAEIERLRTEKERLLNEHYIPMERKLESEIEAISDRILRLESNLASLRKRASDLPAETEEAQRLQAAAIKAHSEMRRAYDEATALIEESSRFLSEERERMGQLADQSRIELSSHNARTNELRGMLEKIGQAELDVQRYVAEARAAVAEQAEKLESAERSFSELHSLKLEIAGNVDSLKREISVTKGMLTTLERQMGQMRQVEDYAQRIRSEYEAKMHGVDDYIRNGNEEFESLRESVEGSFVRKYLRELRQLTDSYSFEFAQVKQAEQSIDARILSEQKKIEQLFEDGKKIAYLYESSAKDRQAEEEGRKFESHAETFRGMEELGDERVRVQQMIAGVVGSKTGYLLDAEKPEEKEREPRMRYPFRQGKRRGRKQGAAKREVMPKAKKAGRTKAWGKAAGKIAAKKARRKAAGKAKAAAMKARKPAMKAGLEAARKAGTALAGKARKAAKKQGAGRFPRKKGNRR